MQVAARQRRFQHVGGIRRALRRPRPDQSVQLVDKQYDVALRRSDFLQQRLQPLFEFTAELGPGDQRAEVERQQPFVLQALGHIAIDDALRQAFGDRRLADTGFADKHGIILRAPRQHLHGAADLLVAANDRIEFALARRLGQVLGILFERVVGVFRSRAVRLAALANIIDRRVQLLRRHAGAGQHIRRIGSLRQRESEQQELRGDVAVAGFLGNLFGLIEQPRRIGCKIDLTGPGAFNARQLVERHFGRGQRARRIAARGDDKAGGEALLVIEQDFQNMQRGELLMIATQRERLRRLDKSARALGVLFLVHFARILP